MNMMWIFWGFLATGLGAGLFVFLSFAGAALFEYFHNKKTIIPERDLKSKQN